MVCLCLLRPERLQRIHFSVLIVLSSFLYISIYIASKNRKYLQEAISLVCDRPSPSSQTLSTKHHETLGDFTLCLDFSGTIFYPFIPPQNSVHVGGKQIIMYIQGSPSFQLVVLTPRNYQKLADSLSLSEGPFTWDKTDPPFLT